MSATDLVQIGDPMPRLRSVAHHRAYEVAVSWEAGLRQDKADVVDLAPVILAYKVFRPLRDNEAMLKTVRLIDDGTAIGWGSEDDALAIAATTIERLAEETMTPADFRDWLERNKLTYDGAAAQLGISRRLVAYYASTHKIPRYIALACRYLDREGDRQGSTVGPLPETDDLERVVAALQEKMKRALGDHVLTSGLLKRQ